MLKVFKAECWFYLIDVQWITFSWIQIDKVIVTLGIEEQDPLRQKEGKGQIAGCSHLDVAYGGS